MKLIKEEVDLVGGRDFCRVYLDYYHPGTEDGPWDPGDYEDANFKVEWQDCDENGVGGDWVDITGTLSEKEKDQVMEIIRAHYEQEKADWLIDQMS